MNSQALPLPWSSFQWIGQIPGPLLLSSTWANHPKNCKGRRFQFARCSTHLLPLTHARLTGTASVVVVPFVFEKISLKKHLSQLGVFLCTSVSVLLNKTLWSLRSNGTDWPHPHSWALGCSLSWVCLSILSSKKITVQFKHCTPGWDLYYSKQLCLREISIPWPQTWGLVLDHHLVVCIV